MSNAPNVRSDGHRERILDESDLSMRHNTRRMLQALDAYWFTIDGLPKGRYPRGRYTAEDWWGRFEKYRAFVEWHLCEDCCTGEGCTCTGACGSFDEPTAANQQEFTPGHLLAAELELRRALDPDEAYDAAMALVSAGFTIVAPEPLRLAALAREESAGV